MNFNGNYPKVMNSIKKKLCLKKDLECCPYYKKINVDVFLDVFNDSKDVKVKWIMYESNNCYNDTQQIYRDVFNNSLRKIKITITELISKINLIKEGTIIIVIDGKDDRDVMLEITI